MVTITFSTDNDAFRMGHGCEEVARVLRTLADHIAKADETIGHVGVIRDPNGNRIGGYEIDAFATDEDDAY